MKRPPFTPEEQVHRDEPRNAALYAMDGICWWVGTAFSDAATVLPTFIRLLGGSNALIGFLTGFRTGGYLLPQLVVAHYIEGWPRKKPLVVVNSLVQRLALLAMAGIVFRHALDQPRPVLIAFVLLYVLGCLSEGINAVPWTDILAKAVQPLRRGALYGRMQVWGGLLAFGAGFGVNRILTGARWPFPANFALLFALTALAYTGSYAAFLLVREPVLPVAGVPRRSLGQFIRSLPGLWRESPAFARLARCRVLFGFSFLAVPFYVLYARDRFGLDPAMVGVFLACQMAGNVGGGLLWGRLADRRGYRLVIILASLCALASPVLALLARPAIAWLPPATVLGAVFVFLGLTFAGTWIGFTGFILELVPSTRRPSYLGLLNTLAGPAALLPVAGGVMVDRLGYLAVFGLAAALLALAVQQSLGLHEPRRMGQDCPRRVENPAGREEAMP